MCQLGRMLTLAQCNFFLLQTLKLCGNLTGPLIWTFPHWYLVIVTIPTTTSTQPNLITIEVGFDMIMKPPHPDLEIILAFLASWAIQPKLSAKVREFSTLSSEFPMLFLGYWFQNSLTFAHRSCKWWASATCTVSLTSWLEMRLKMSKTYTFLTAQILRK